MAAATRPIPVDEDFEAASRKAVQKLRANEIAADMRGPRVLRRNTDCVRGEGSAALDPSIAEPRTDARVLRVTKLLAPFRHVVVSRTHGECRGRPGGGDERRVTRPQCAEIVAQIGQQLMKRTIDRRRRRAILRRRGAKREPKSQGAGAAQHCKRGYQ